VSFVPESPTYYRNLKPHTTPKLQQALLQLIMTQPFWGTLALHMDMVPDPGIDTMCTDGKRIYYSEKFVDSLTTAKIIFAIAHECGHPMLHHLTRRYNRPPGDTGDYGSDETGKPFGVEPRTWNIAGDRIINRMLKDSGFSLWEHCIIGPQTDVDKTTEEIYRELQQKQQQKQSQGGSGNMRAGQGSGIPKPQQAGGKPAGPGCEKNGKPDEGGDMRSPAPEAKEQDWNEIVVKAAAIAKAQGKLPASIEAAVIEATEPQYPFYLILEQFVDECTKGDDYSWHKPHRDFFSRGIIMPGPYDESISHVVIVFDTSGSVSDVDLTRFARITGDIMRRLKPQRLTLIMCDANVSDDDVLEIRDWKDWPREIKLTGRGGTSFKPPFRYVKEKRLKPSCLVYMTDMYGDFPEQPPQYPVFWASTTKGKKAPFGRTVYINQ
jgi:predicted metal-dependent peptidase